MPRPPIFDRPMTPADRKRRSREHGGELRKYSAPRLAGMLGGSPQFYRDLAFVRQHGVPEWVQLTNDGKGRFVIGASTQRLMVKHLSPEDQLHMIKLAKEDKKGALQLWRLVKADIGIK